MTEELFREDATLLRCEATVLAIDDAGIVLDRTVFYPLGGGQAGDAGTLTAGSGAVLAITDTRKHPSRPGAIAHLAAPGSDTAAFTPGTRVVAGVVDAYSETVPMSQRDTHAAFGFNAPAARAPV